ncbi:MAG: glycosyltransferase N-terminal domain-containing protein [candidate division WOR-3 bacterium]
MGVIEVAYKILSFLSYPLGKNRIKDFRADKDSIWFHAASLGEVISIKPLIDYFKGKGISFFLTTMTESGKKLAEEDFKGNVFLFPYDNPLFIKEILKKSKLIVFAESEFWPNTILEIRKNKKRIILVNGRISENSFRKWKVFKNFFKKILFCFDRFFVISSKEKKYLKYFGADNKKIFVSGNLKLLSIKREVLPLFDKPFDFTITFASVRSGEFKGLVNFIEKVIKINEKIGFIIAVRHLSTLILLENILRVKNIKYVKFTENREKIKEKKRVLILDTLGDLIRVYPVSDAVIVGGTFAPYGGHNLLEPAQFGVPVFFGPYTSNVKGMEEILLKERGGIKCKTFDELFEIFLKLVNDKKEIENLGRNAKRAFERARKITENGFNEIVKYLESNL